MVKTIIQKASISKQGERPSQLVRDAPWRVAEIGVRGKSAYMSVLPGITLLSSD